MRPVDADACEPYFYEHLDDSGMVGALNAIAEMPTIPMLDTPISEWISLYNTVARDRKWCERCRYEAPRIVKGYHWTDDGKWVVETKQYLPRFCPCCGARMKGADNEQK